MTQNSIIKVVEQFQPPAKEVDTALQKRRFDAAEMKLKGNTIAEIAEAQNLSVSTIRNDIKWVEEQWARRSIAKIEKIRAEQLAQIDLVIKESWAAWEASKLNRQTITNATRGYASKQSQEEITVEEIVNNGDDKFLKMISWAITERNKMLGLYAPKKHQIIDKKLDVNRLMEQFSAEQLIRVVNGEDPILVALDDYSTKKLPRTEIIYDADST